MRRVLGLLSVIVLIFLVIPCIGEETTLKVEQMEFCAAVKDRTPVGAAQTFPSDIYRIYCFTRVIGATDTTEVIHEWYYGEKKMAAVRLPVRSSSWRTWSSKRMIPQWTGKWRVDVLDEDSTVIASKEFIVE